jgi:transcriptional antiterminator RfaH
MSESVLEQSAWYLVRAKPRQELRALANLQNQGMHAFMPQLTVTKFRRGQRTKVVEPMFPGYVFVEIDDYGSMFYKIKSTFGVAKVVTFGSTPARLPTALVAELQAIDAEHNNQIGNEVPSVGTKVEIIDGPFKGLLAEVIELDGAERCVLLIDWLQQQVKGHFSYDQVVKIKN